jgi:XTP/dITP diphosphohydrolase
MKLLFASKNKHKLTEISHIFELAGLDYIELDSVVHDDRITDIPEEFDTIEENAAAKAGYIFNITNDNVFADDTGLEIEALDGRPGAFAARYAGENCSFQDNVNKVLHELEGITNRKACFRTVICLILDGEQHLFEGRVDGEITVGQSGGDGFGYDPVFKPIGYTQTFAEMPADLKNQISHRALAMQKMIAFLKGR